MSELFTADQITPATRQHDLAKLEFSYNWNKKLDCISYTTLRLANLNKYQIGRKFGVYLNGKYHHDAEIIDVKSVGLDQINEWIARLDTGYSREKCIDIIQKMYKGKPINWEIQKLNWVLFRKLDYNAKL